MSFKERLQIAARRAGAGDSQAAIAARLERNPQTVNRWFQGGEPNAEQLLHVAKTYGVNVEWLLHGDAGGDMLPPANDLPEDEQELLKVYRKATANGRSSILQVARALRKSVVTIAAVLPGFMASNDGQAGILHNQNSELLGSERGHITHCMQFLLSAFRKLRARFSKDGEPQYSAIKFA